MEDQEEAKTIAELNEQSDEWLEQARKEVEQEKSHKWGESDD